MLTTLITTVLSFRTDRKGVTALEYGLIASLIAVAIITSAMVIQLVRTHAPSSAADRSQCRCDGGEDRAEVRPQRRQRTDDHQEDQRRDQRVLERCDGAQIEPERSRNDSNVSTHEDTFTGRTLQRVLEAPSLAQPGQAFGV